MAQAAENMQLATRQQAGELAIPEELTGFTGVEGISEEALIVPRIKIVQPTSKEGAAGTLRMNLTGDEFESLSIVMVKAQQGRILWSDSNDEQGVLCRSNDFLVPDPSIENPIAQTCAKKVPGKGGKTVLRQICPKSIWGPEGERPECDTTYNILCILTDELLPFWITLSGTSIKPVRQYISAIVLRRIPLWQYQTTLSLREQTNNKGRFFVADFGRPAPISVELEQQIVPLIIGLKDVDIRRTFEAEEESGDPESYEPGAPPAAEPGDPGPQTAPEVLDDSGPAGQAENAESAKGGGNNVKRPGWMKKSA